MHELNTKLSKEQRKQKTIIKAISDYRYKDVRKIFNFSSRFGSRAMKKALITGITGQDGSYLAGLLLGGGMKFMA